MSRKVFEYYFDPEDLEPFYSELPRSKLTASTGLDKREAGRVNGTLDSADGEDSFVNGTEENSGDDDGAGASVDESGKSQPKSAEMPSDMQNGADPRAAGKVAGSGHSDQQVASSDQRTRVRRLISVHALGQYVFCVRSSILSAEIGDQRDIDEPQRRFTYLPNFDRERIEEVISAKITQFGFFVLYGVCLGILMKMGLAEQNRWVFYPSLAALLGLAFWSLEVLVSIVDLASRRRAAIKAEAREPEPNIANIERVNWWSMLQAGFAPVEYQRQFQHPELPLEGSPWRVLERDSRRIPVIKSGVPQLGPQPGELFAKHQVRLVAYALLLEAASHIKVPYGIVFPVDSPHGLAYPITDELRDRCRNLLYEFEEKLTASQREKIQPGLPENPNRCARCDYGRPAATTLKEIENADRAGEQLVVLEHSSGDLYRCQCADRFGSAPPHELTVRKRLRAVVR